MAKRRKHKRKDLNDPGMLRFWLEILLALGVVAGISYLAVSLF